MGTGRLLYQIKSRSLGKSCENRDSDNFWRLAFGGNNVKFTISIYLE